MFQFAGYSFEHCPLPSYHTFSPPNHHLAYEMLGNLPNLDPIATTTQAPLPNRHWTNPPPKKSTMHLRTPLLRIVPRALPLAARTQRPYSSSKVQPDSVHQVPANTPTPAAAKQTVSETNATATSSEGSFDKVLQESVERAEELRTLQAPNRGGVWTRSQQPRAVAMSGPRFEQTIMEDQVCHTCAALG